MAAPEHLRDHPAHRRADDVRPVDPKMVEEAAGVFGHVDERVRHRAAAPERVPDDAGVHRPVGLLPGHLRRQADVAVVVADHPKPALDQQLAEPVRPHRQLRTDAHDEQDGRACRVAEVLVEQLDRV
jgi:hypothetical protein